MTEGITISDTEELTRSLLRLRTRKSHLEKHPAIGKFARASAESDKVVYEVTEDPAYLHQYYILRENMYISVWGLDNFDGSEDEFDARSTIMVARQGNHVIGGCRLIVHAPDDTHRLPMEGDDFLLPESLPGLNLPNKNYAEFSRLAVLPEFRLAGVTREIFRRYYKICKKMKIDYVFAVSPVSQSRSYRRNCNALGFDFKLVDTIEMPEREDYEGIAMCLMMCDMHAAALKGN